MSRVEKGLRSGLSLPKIWGDLTACIHSKDAEKVNSPVVEIRRIKRPDVINILRWSANPETRRHLDPAPKLPKDWSNSEGVQDAVDELWDYYRNFGEPNKISPLVAANKFGPPIGVTTIRWHGDPYVPIGQGIASIERLIVNPEFCRKGIASELMASALHLAFDVYKGYKTKEEPEGRGAKEIRAWVMADKEAGEYSRNINLMSKFGFRVVQGVNRHWRDYAQRRGIETNRDAFWFSLQERDYCQLKQDNPNLFEKIYVKIKKEGII